MPEVSESKIDQLEEQLKGKIEVMSGFAEKEVQKLKLDKIFKYFDSDNSNAVDFEEFQAALVRMNFVGVQREVEALFDRYDEDASGLLEFGEFSNKLLGIGPAAQLSGASRSIVERVKNKIIERGGANGIRTCTRLLKRMDKDGSLSLDKEELLEGLCVYGIRNIDDTEGGDLDKLMKFFDRDSSGKISIEEFLRGVRGNMPGKRKKLVRQAYNCLDVTADGQVTIDDFIQAYDATHHPQVIAGEITPEEAVEEFMENFEKKESDGVLSWIEFLDYYKDISAGIDHDDYFELMIRNAWHMSGGEGWAANTSCRRVLVTYTDGSQKVVEIENDLGLRADDIEGMKMRLEKQGEEGIAKISLAD